MGGGRVVAAIVRITLQDMNPPDILPPSKSDLDEDPETLRARSKTLAGWRGWPFGFGFGFWLIALNLPQLNSQPPPANRQPSQTQNRQSPTAKRATEANRQQSQVAPAQHAIANQPTAIANSHQPPANRPTANRQFLIFHLTPCPNLRYEPYYARSRSVRYRIGDGIRLPWQKHERLQNAERRGDRRNKIEAVAGPGARAGRSDTAVEQ